jgi:hypothetical protein
MCPICLKEGRQTRAWMNSSEYKAIEPILEFDDEHGVHHCHDSNVTKQFWQCVEGHEFTNRSIEACCNDFPGDDGWDVEHDTIN